MIPKVGEDVEQFELSYIIGSNGKWYIIGENLLEVFISSC